MNSMKRKTPSQQYKWLLSTFKAEFFKAYRLTLENKVSILQQIKSEKNEEEIEEMIEKTKAKLESITEAPDNQKNCEEETVEEPVPVVNNEEKEIDYELTKEEEISFILLEIDSKVPKLNEEIEKDALLNYARLSYEIGNAYEPVPQVISSYLEKYPKDERQKELQALLVDSYITSKNLSGSSSETMLTNRLSVS